MPRHPCRGGEGQPKWPATSWPWDLTSSSMSFYFLQCFIFLQHWHWETRSVTNSTSCVNVKHHKSSTLFFPSDISLALEQAFIGIRWRRHARWSFEPQPTALWLCIFYQTLSQCSRPLLCSYSPPLWWPIDTCSHVNTRLPWQEQRDFYSFLGLACCRFLLSSKLFLNCCAERPA